MSKTRESVTEKRTVITSSTSSGYDDDLDKIHYTSNIHPRTNVLTRSSTSSIGGPGFRHSLGSSGGGTTLIRTVEMGYGAGSHSSLGPGGFEKVSNTGVANVKTTREQEKREMRDLNERFANYIEKVRFLEAQNRKLASELEQLKSKWGKETSMIKQMYETELAEARKLIDDLTREKANLEIKNNSLQEQMGDMQRQLDDAKRYHEIDRDQINKLNQQLSEYESEINLLRRTIESLETERARDRERLNRLQQEVDKLRVDLNNETLNHLDAENRRQSLEEELEFQKKLHEQELKELAALTYRDTTAENREFWKSELSQAIRDIQNEYDDKVDQIRGDMESFYNLKIQEFRTGATKQNMEVTHVREENKKLIKQMTDLKGRLADLEARNAQLEKQYQDLLREYESIESEHTMEIAKYKEEITVLRSEMESILQELQTLMDAKLSLELEIAAYRKLLEGEETRSFSSPFVRMRYSADPYKGPRKNAEEAVDQGNTTHVGNNNSGDDLDNQLDHTPEGRVGLRNVVEQAVSSQSKGGAMLSEMISGYESKGDSSVSMKMMRGEVSAKTTYQRTSSGPISISEVCPEGKFLAIENTSSGAKGRELNLDGWKLKRVVDGKKTHIYNFRNFVLKPGKSVKIVCRSAAHDAGINDLVNRDEDTWGVGSEVKTTLINERDEEKASHTQKTLYN